MLRTRLAIALLCALGGCVALPVAGPAGGDAGSDQAAADAIATAVDLSGDAGRVADGAGDAKPRADTRWCSAATCPDGCCEGNVCRAVTLSKCGIFGGTCKTCKSGERCSSAGGCELDPSAKWHVTISRIETITTYLWDGPGIYAPPDLYVCATVAKVITCSTPPQYDSYVFTSAKRLISPTAAQLIAGFDLWLRDDEDKFPDETVGRCTVKAKATDLFAGKLTLTKCTNPDDKKDYVTKADILFALATP